MKSFEDQLKLEDQTKIIVIDEYNKFQQTKREFEVLHAYRSGYWNCYRPTVELIQHLEEHDINYHITTKDV